MKFLKNRRLWTQLVTAVVIVSASVGATIYFKPVQFSEWMTELAFLRGGVKHVTAGGLVGYTRDTCEAGKPCTCVALIHGLGDYAMTWYKILPAEASKFSIPVKLYAFNLPGTRGSEAPQDPSGYRVRAQAAKLKEVLAPLCAEWVVMGNSLGGWIAVWMALDWPEGVKRLVLTNSAGIPREADDRKVAEMLAKPTIESLQAFQKMAYAKPRPLPDYAWRGALEWQKSGNAYAVAIAQKPEDYVEGILPQLKQPTLLLWGATDQVMPVERGRAFKAKIPHAELREIADCGHLPHKECIDEVFKAIAGK